MRLNNTGKTYNENYLIENCIEYSIHRQTNEFPINRLLIFCCNNYNNIISIILKNQ